MNYESATKQETGIIYPGHLVWMFTLVADHVILILIVSEKLKAYYKGLCFGTQSKLKFIPKKLYQKYLKRENC